MRRAVRLSFGFFALLGLVLAVWAGTAGHAPAAETEIVEIASKTGVHVFAVEMAVTDEQRSRGLMHRKSLPAGGGMLFDF